ncbi:MULTISPECIES: acetyl-CoA decarbonylase/synthase complex subunit alpha/beta [unclassified Clostridioides]|uniref:acetyl-CoA decarbonylase/synthase complex subunit alpha/beta n=1 Tax=unclassified Clostridioides TaxID=2635829 RepID=UPI001D119AC9|nr:CO dehydrogenase/CO-methylating acetyl-CoA synthase complex subunit beta [Clostridioides sp. ZZV14-6150]MCC0668693.1 CO dehydrogenase/CO-methylating acetyl-CoA synthase complex subunit beta [Clostridioides sp. ZZV14-6153]MCC0721967.1 CO dehydrogenase/CO-methylating acetyl-CoA synthase complex subunit beta [Clostridioides sp. ZZV14-6104]MCC0743801.1 CO dehydrogenase/CO-methylating acetyl-CoA synthase complex subunit beta [Clostridioides sp. ZZV14-6044]MCC0752365.1 CO dehydrogenase/CO-methylat
MNLYNIIFTGSEQALGAAQAMLAEAIEKNGKEHKVAFPDTAYSLPCIYAATGQKMNTLGDLEGALEVVKSLINRTHLLEHAFNAGLATALAAEVIEALKYSTIDAPYSEPCAGHITDPIIRSLGVPLVTGDIPGVAVVLGECPDAESAAKVIKDYQSKGLLTFLVGKVIDQAIEAGVKMGLELRVIPLGYDVTSVIHVVSVAVRAALIFGGLTPGDLNGLLEYTANRVPAFVNAFGPLSELVVSAGAGAIALGFPVITDQTVLEVPMNLLTQKDYDKIVATSLEARGIKIKVTEIPIPVSFAAAFEGERIRKSDMFAEFGGNKTEAWELVVKKEATEVEDHKIEIIGPNIDEVEADGVLRLPLAVIVKIAGKNMQEDFEPVLERRFHYFLNYIEGVMHVGQRDMAWVRISKDAFDKGFRLEHIGEVLYAKMLDEFESVVDKCEITIITDAEKVSELKGEAIAKYNARDERLASLVDESVETFYSCNLCQSFAPAHVCVVTPERLGLCGAVSWLDAKATKELDPTGPCQPIEKGECLDDRTGVWNSVNETVNQISQGAVEAVTLYSILEDPMTSCGCFECICGIMPEANGFVVVNREFPSVTPVGMTFGELASMTGGGVQTPGFMGHGRHFISSKKFAYAEGGPERIVWMPKELKEYVADKLNATVKEMTGIENFCDMICDETIADDSEGVLAFLEEKGHPALAMESVM